MVRRLLVSIRGRGGFEQSLMDIFTTGGQDPISLNVLFPLGSPNTFSYSSLCNNAHGVMAPMTTFGVPPGPGFSWFSQEWADCRLGSEPSHWFSTYPFRGNLRGQGEGTKVVVIDPLNSYTAEKADEWIGIRPGTDGALALGIAHVIMEGGLFDSEFADDWTLGLGKFKEYLKGFSPKEVEKMTWVKAEKITRLARDLTRFKSALFLFILASNIPTAGFKISEPFSAYGPFTGNLDRPEVLSFVCLWLRPFRRNRIDPPKENRQSAGIVFPLFAIWTRVDIF